MIYKYILTYLNIFFFFIKLGIFLKYSDNKELTDNDIKYIETLVFSNGVTCIKIFQWINNVGVEKNIFYNKFNKLQDDCPKHNINYTKNIINKECKNIDCLDEKPIFSGTIGQIYKAKFNNKDVVLKVKHPDIELNIECWFNVISIFNWFVKFKMYDLNNLKTQILTQLDFRKEYNNLKTFRNNFKHIEYINIPEPFFVSKNLLIMEYIPSIKFIDLLNNNYNNCNDKIIKESSIIVSLLILHMIIIDNFIHGDMHYGNWGIITKNNQVKKIILYDCGIIGYSNDSKLVQQLLVGFLKSNQILILTTFNSYLKKYSKEIPITIYNETLKKWNKDFNWHIDMNILITKIAKCNIIIPAELLTVVLTFTLLGKINAIALNNTDKIYDIILRKSNKHMRLLNLYNNSIIYNFSDIQKFLEKEYINSTDMKAFSYGNNNKFNFNFKEINEDSDDSE